MTNEIKNNTKLQAARNLVVYSYVLERVVNDLPADNLTPADSNAINDAAAILVDQDLHALADSLLDNTQWQANLANEAGNIAREHKLDELIKKLYVLIDTHFSPEPCQHCGKTDFEISQGCKNPIVNGPDISNWICDFDRS